jgi:hypothetical protein
LNFLSLILLSVQKTRPNMNAVDSRLAQVRPLDPSLVSVQKQKEAESPAEKEVRRLSASLP